jgi:xylan 1,4-beta-xylosidase
MTKILQTKCLIVAVFAVLLQLQTVAQTEAARIEVDLSTPIGAMTPIWAWFGYDEPNYTYMKDGRKLLSELAALSPVPVYVRTHNLLTSGDGTAALKWGSTNAYTEDANGNPVYNWRIIDSIFDTYVKRGMKPMAEISFMPEALSIKPQPYKHDWQPGQPYGKIFTGWRFPPKDYNKWSELIYQWIKHSVARYGQKEVESWYWELWNEPDLGYWGGTLQEFFKLYDYTAVAVKRALPTARIGGPHVTGPLGRGSGYRFLEAFLKHCVRDTNYATGRPGVPLDFIAFHAKGAPQFLNGHVRMNLGTQLRAISNGFQLVASFPELKDLPVIIGESDPEGCAACGMTTNPENGYRNGTMFSSYTAAAFARKYALADSFKINFKGAVSWAFEFEDQPWFHGFRDLATNGVDKPVLNVFRMYGKMGGNRVKVGGNQQYTFIKIRDSSVRRGPDIDALATIDKRVASVMVWNYHDSDTIAPVSQVEVRVKGIAAKKATLKHFRIDSNHSNSYEVWKKMGSPQQPTAAQIATLEKAGQLEMLEPPRSLAVTGGEALIKMDLPRQGVSLLQLSW